MFQSPTTTTAISIPFLFTAWLLVLCFLDNILIYLERMNIGTKNHNTCQSANNFLGAGRTLSCAKVNQGVKSYFGRESWLEKICATVSLFILAKDSHDLREATMQLFGWKNPLLRHSQLHTHTLHLGFAVKLPVTVNRYSPVPTD